MNDATRSAYRIYLSLREGEFTLSEWLCNELAGYLMPRIQRVCRAHYPVIGEDLRDGMCNATLHEILKVFERQSIEPTTVQEMDAILAGVITNGLRKAYRDQVAIEAPTGTLDDAMVDGRAQIDEAGVDRLVAELPERVYAHVQQRARFKISPSALRYAVDALMDGGDVEPALLVTFGPRRKVAAHAPLLLAEHVQILVRDALYRFREQVEDGLVEVS